MAGAASAKERRVERAVARAVYELNISHARLGARPPCARERGALRTHIDSSAAPEHTADGPRRIRRVVECPSFQLLRGSESPPAHTRFRGDSARRTIKCLSARSRTPRDASILSITDDRALPVRPFAASRRAEAVSERRKRMER
jgi:hypothetical protein